MRKANQLVTSTLNIPKIVQKLMWTSFKERNYAFHRCLSLFLQNQMSGCHAPDLGGDNNFKVF